MATDPYENITEALTRARREADKQGRVGYNADAELDALNEAKQYIDLRRGQILGEPGAPEDKDVRA